MLRLCVLLLLLAMVLCVAVTADKAPDQLSENHEASRDSEGHDNDAGVKKRSIRSKFHAFHAKLKRKALPSRVKRDVTCNKNDRYRSADGTCNNLNNTYWGSVDQAYLRLLDPVYCNNVSVPRLRQTDGNYLPSPRDVSTNVHYFDRNRYHPRGSVMFMEWGQFLSHDIVGTPEDDEDLEDCSCCYDELVTNPSILHPDVESGGPCFPIIISEGDNYFTNVSTRCMEFVRSSHVNDSDGVRQQINLMSAYIDGTTVYGRNQDEMDSLRSFSGGKLLVKNGDDLPESSDSYCIITDNTTNDYCLETGNPRVNGYPALGALHTIFLRYHNYVAEQLAIKYPKRKDEKLFQETRKIVIAVLQRITYREYIPMIIGSDAVSTYGLADTWSYDNSCDATIANVFATAALRFGHSMVPDALLINGVNISSVDLYNRPYYVLNFLDSLVEGLVKMRAELADRFYSLGIKDQLFEEIEQHGYDIASLNIQRGRDHGLPPYNDWREYCGLGRYDSIDDMRSSGVFKKVYNDVDDVDLYSGALAEKPVSTVGETYVCLMGKLFARLRNCDRFWWENEDSTVGFKRNAQRNQIKKIRLSHVICLTTNITSIQKSVFRIPSDNNVAESCETLLGKSGNYSKF